MAAPWGYQTLLADAPHTQPVTGETYASVPVIEVYGDPFAGRGGLGTAPFRAMCKGPAVVIRIALVVRDEREEGLDGSNP